MTTEMRSIWSLKQNEKEACTVLSKMVSTDNVVFDKCEENDRIYTEAKELLNGEDPIKFAVEILTLLHGSWTKAYFLNQYRNYLR